MASEKVTAIVEELKGLTVLELSELVHAVEDEFGVSAAAALVGAGIGTIFYLIITNFKSPMYISSSGAFVAPVLAALTLGGYTGAAIGGVISCIIYCIFGYIFSKVDVDNIYKIFPKTLIGAITAVIGINLMPFCLTYVQIAGQTSIWGVVIAFITMTAIATSLFFSPQPIHKTRFIQQRPSHLYKFKTIIQYLIYLFTRYQPSHIY